MEDTLRIFTATSCDPCEDIKKAIDEGRLEVEGTGPKTRVLIHDVTEEDNFHFVEEFDLDDVPSAYIGTRKCRLFINPEDNTVSISCIPDNNPSDDGQVQPSDHEPEPNV